MHITGGTAPATDPNRVASSVVVAMRSRLRGMDSAIDSHLRSSL